MHSQSCKSAPLPLYLSALLQIQYSKLQARQVFAAYLECVQRRLLRETQYANYNSYECMCLRILLYHATVVGTLKMMPS